MFYIIGRISNHAILETTCIYTPVDMVAYKKAIAINYGGVPADYSVLALDDDSSEVRKIREGCGYIALWKENIIIGVCFDSVKLKTRFQLLKECLD